MIKLVQAPMWVIKIRIWMVAERNFVDNPGDSRCTLPQQNRWTIIVSPLALLIRLSMAEFVLIFGPFDVVLQLISPTRLLRCIARVHASLCIHRKKQCLLPLSCFLTTKNSSAVRKPGGSGGLNISKSGGITHEEHLINSSIHSTDKSE